MDNKEATHTCGQCLKEVAEANFALHETHCSRFLCLCPDCGEAVPREQLDQHREEEHSQTRCKKCNQKMERCQLKDHELECVPASRRDDSGGSEPEEEGERDEEELSSLYKAASLSDRPHRPLGFWGEGGDPDQLNTCPHCHLVLPLVTLRWHEAKCQIFTYLKEKGEEGKDASEISDQYVMSKK